MNRAVSRNNVVLPVPGGPNNNSDFALRGSRYPSGDDEDKVVDFLALLGSVTV